MDCCNYLPYRQAYYGGYYEHCPYPGDFYAYPYHEYGYGTPPYYPQHWPCSTSMPDYVYNPKEARIRKALRDASRDRSMGSTAMPPLRNSGRRQGWMQNHEEQLMMTPQEVLRSSMDPLCNSANSYGGENVSPFIPIGGYGKDIMSSPSSFHSSSSYLQTIQNPMVQLQQESAGSWSSYGERMVSRTSDNYMLPDMHTYHHVQQPKQQEIKSMTRHSTDALDVQTNKFINNELQRPEENHSGTEAASKSKYLMADEMFDGKGDDVMCRRGIQSAGTFVSTYTENMTTNVGCKAEGVGRSKKTGQLKFATVSNKKPPKSLPDFNEAFGSTERGRFQSPPDPRLVQHDKGFIDYFFNHSPVKYDDYHIE